MGIMGNFCVLFSAHVPAYCADLSLRVAGYPRLFISSIQYIHVHCSNKYKLENGTVPHLFSMFL